MGRGNKVVHIMPHSHIDVEWYWTYETTVEWSRDIIGRALALLRRDPDYRFNQDQVAVIKPVLEGMSAEGREFLLQAVREGRFHVFGGMYVQPEVAEPRGESLIRQILAGKKWFSAALGVDVQVAWLCDTFGQMNQIPQILARSGFKYYSFMRDVAMEMDLAEVPADFYYESPDGSRILTHLMPAGYGASHRGARSLRTIARRSPTRHLLFPWGEDVYRPDKDSGAMTARLAAWASDVGLSEEIGEIRVATALDYFQAVEREGADLPVLRCEFNPPYHVQDLRGCYDNRIELKKLSRAAEEALYTAEAASSVAFTLGRAYPQEAIESLWLPLLHEQFHDIIGGSHYDPVYQKAMRAVQGVLDGAQALTAAATAAIVGSEQAGGEAVYVFNPLASERSELCRVAAEGAATLVDGAGRPLPQRLAVGEGGKAQIEFVAEQVPAAGGKVYRLAKDRKGLQGQGGGEGRRVGPNSIENRLFRVTWDPATGGLASIYDRANGRELIDAGRGQGNELIAVVEEQPDMEGMLYPTEVAFRSGDYRPEAIEVEESPIHLGVTVRGPFVDCRRVQRVLLYDALPRIDFETTLEGYTGGDHLVKVSFPLAIDWSRATADYETPFAVTRQPRGHHAAQNWVDCSDGSHGVALINTGTPGYWVGEGRLEMVILRSFASYEGYRRAGQYHGLPEYGEDTLTALAREHGTHHYRYALYSHSGPWQESDVVAVGRSLNTPLVAVPIAEVGVRPAAQQSLVSAPREFGVTAIKLAEAGGALVVRGYETTGQRREVALRLPAWARRAALADLLEAEQVELPIRDGMVTIQCAPHEIVTLILKG